MPKVSRVRPILGDIVEINTPKGFAYAQYTHKHTKPPRFGELIRVLPGLFEEEPEDFSQIVRERERFFVFFPLSAACNRRIVSIIANEKIPPIASDFPLLRQAGFVDRDGKVHDWWIFDGKRERRPRRSDPQIASLSPCEIWNDTLLIERIAEGWSIENDYLRITL